jgi:hypothetical protein
MTITIYGRTIRLISEEAFCVRYGQETDLGGGRPSGQVAYGTGFVAFEPVEFVILLER